MFPTPQELGLPSKFKAWRPNQPTVITDIVECPRRFLVQVQRAGAGKTLSYMAALMMQVNQRAMVLTVTKTLQDQLHDEFSDVGMVDIRGKASYQCQGRLGNTCETGSIAKCPYKATSLCPHTAAKSAASNAPFVVSNYACWMAANHYGQGYGRFDCLVLDEAHEAPNQLVKAMQIRISHQDLETLKHDWPDHRSRNDMEAWKWWAAVAGKLAENKVAELEGSLAAKPRKAEVDRLRHVKLLSRNLAELHNASAANWVCQEWNYGYQFDPIEASQYAERMLFCRTPKVLMTSGTITHKVVEELGIAEDSYEYKEYYQRVTPARSPLYWLPTLRVTKAVQDWELRKVLVERIDEIIESRLDRKGVIHTSNFKIRDLIVEHSRFGDNGKGIMLTNRAKGATTGRLVQEFRRMDAPMWFVSASLGTGVDLPHDACRVQIIAKLPFGSLGSKVEQARTELDKDRGIREMFARLAQQFGRADRADDDWQEVFVLDDLISWVWRKFPDLIPISLLPYYRPIRELPPAPELGTNKFGGQTGHG